MKQQNDRKKYQIFVDKENILRIYDQQYPTEESVRGLSKELIKILQEQHIEKAMVDITGQDFKHLAMVRNQMAKFFSQDIQKIKPKKIAMIGASPFLRVICNFMFNSGKLGVPRFFATEKEALQWLHADN